MLDPRAGRRQHLAATSVTKHHTGLVEDAERCLMDGFDLFRSQQSERTHRSLHITLPLRHRNRVSEEVHRSDQAREDRPDRMLDAPAQETRTVRHVLYRESGPRPAARESNRHRRADDNVLTD